MKQGLKKGITVLMISAMLASTSTVSYASEIENQNMAETMNVADTENPSPNANGLNTSGNQSDSVSVNMNSQLSDDPVDVPDVNEPSDDDVDQYEGDENTDPSEETLQGWVSGDDGTRYYIDNTFVVGEKKIDGYWYYFNANGVMATGWTVQEGRPDRQYYYDTDGKVHYGWLTEGDKTYYFHPVTGVMLKQCERKIDNAYYYFNADGVMATGWTVQEGRPDRQYYYDEDGKIHYGWLTLDGKTYYFHPVTGIMQKQCERKVDNKYYYFNADGVMATGWTVQEGRPDKRYYYDADGSMCYGEKKIDGHWYYFHPVTGVMMTGWVKHHNHTYYYNADGSMYYGEKKFNGHWYYFRDVTGIMATGWAKHHGHTYFYNDDGTMYYGEKKINGCWYYFRDITGIMATGWTVHHSKQYYYAEDGKMCYGLQTIDNVRYYFHPVTGVYQWKNRKYQNPSQYYQIQESSIQLSGGGYNLNIGYEGIKTAWVIRALNLGNAVGMGGAEYTRRVFNAVKSFQSRHGLEATGITDLATWRALGYSESDWYSLGAYASPIRTSIYSSRSDCIEAMIGRAYDYMGDDYMIGASGAPGLGIDCSGLVMQALYAAGIDMSPINPVRHASPGYEYESANIWTSSQLKHVSYSERQRGDIIIYCNSAGVVIHSAIYLGNNRVIEAWPNKVVVSSMINNQHPRVLGVVRPFV